MGSDIPVPAINICLPEIPGIPDTGDLSNMPYTIEDYIQALKLKNKMIRRICAPYCPSDITMGGGFRKEGGRTNPIKMKGRNRVLNAYYLLAQHPDLPPHPTIKGGDA